MAKPDMSNIDDLAELEQLIASAKARKGEIQLARRAEGLAKLDALADEYDIPRDVVARHFTKKRQSSRRVAPKYRDPDVPTNTWAGRGKRPRWLEAKLKSGAKLDDFAVDRG